MLTSRVGLSALRICLIAAATLLLSSCANPIERNADALMADLYAQGGFTGAVVIAKDGGIVYERGFGMADATRPFAPDTATESGSLAKPVTATAVLLLASEGKLDLDAPAQSYAAEFPYPDVTVRHLLSHSAGLPDYDAFEDLIAGGAPTDNVSLLKAMGARQPSAAFLPGSAFEYCNLCYDALAAVVAGVSGESYADFIAHRLFEPAGMTDSYVRPARLADWPGPRALGYKVRESGTTLNDVFDNEGFHGGGNINFSARDIARWMNLWAMGEAIPPAVREAAALPARAAGAPSDLTLGNWYCGARHTACYYTGHHQGFHAFSYEDSQRKISVAFISNNSLTSPLQPALARALVETAEGKKAGRLIYDESAETREAPIARLAGDYVVAGAGDFSIAVDGDWAFLEIEDRPRLRLYPIGFDGLYAPGAGVYLFVDPSTNAVTWSTTFVEAQARRR